MDRPPQTRETLSDVYSHREYTFTGQQSGWESNSLCRSVFPAHWLSGWYWSYRTVWHWSRQLLQMATSSCTILCPWKSELSRQSRRVHRQCWCTVVSLGAFLWCLCSPLLSGCRGCRGVSHVHVSWKSWCPNRRKTILSVHLGNAWYRR